MPFQSNAQRAFMFAKHPEIAKKWVKEYGGGGKKLPEYKHEKPQKPLPKSPWLHMK